MKKQKEILVPEVKAHKKIVEVYICDLCQFESDNFIFFTKCCLCDRMICFGLSKQCVRYDPECIGDYPDHYCPVCYKLRFEDNKEEFDLIVHEANEKKENLINKIRQQSLSI